MFLLKNKKRKMLCKKLRKIIRKLNKNHNHDLIDILIISNLYNNLKLIFIKEYMVASKLFGGSLMAAGIIIFVYYTLWVFVKVPEEIYFSNLLAIS